MVLLPISKYIVYLLLVVPLKHHISNFFNNVCVVQHSFKYGVNVMILITELN